MVFLVKLVEHGGLDGRASWAWDKTSMAASKTWHVPITRIVFKMDELHKIQNVSLSHILSTNWKVMPLDFFKQMENH